MLSKRRQLIMEERYKRQRAKRSRLNPSINPDRFGDFLGLRCPECNKFMSHLGNNYDCKDGKVIQTGCNYLCRKCNIRETENMIELSEKSEQIRGHPSTELGVGQ